MEWVFWCKTEMGEIRVAQLPTIKNLKDKKPKKKSESVVGGYWFKWERGEFGALFIIYVDIV